MDKTAPDANVQKSNCRFQVRMDGGKPRIKLDLYQTVSSLAGMTIEFELMGGVTAQQAKTLAETINDKVLGIVLTQS